MLTHGGEIISCAALLLLRDKLFEIPKREREKLISRSQGIELVLSRIETYNIDEKGVSRVTRCGKGTEQKKNGNGKKLGSGLVKREQNVVLRGVREVAALARLQRADYKSTLDGIANDAIFFFNCISA